MKNFVKTSASWCVYVLVTLALLLLVFRLTLEMSVLILPRAYGFQLLERIGIPYSHLISTNLHDEQAARVPTGSYLDDHESVRAWIMSRLNIENAEDLPLHLRDVLSIEEEEVFYSTSVANRTSIATPPEYIELGQLSSLLVRERRNLDHQVSASSVLAKAGAFSSILFGFCTTVLVALRASDVFDAKGISGKSIQVGTLITPALGTAVAAMIAFYDPSGSLARQTQASNGLHQLHDQIAVTVWTIGEDKVTADLKKQLESWSQRYQTLVVSLNDNRASGPSGNNDGKKTGEGSSGNSGVNDSKGASGGAMTKPQNE